jgi:hypothetical protein
MPTPLALPLSNKTLGGRENSEDRDARGREDRETNKFLKALTGCTRMFSY